MRWQAAAALAAAAFAAGDFAVCIVNPTSTKSAL